MWLFIDGDIKLAMSDERLDEIAAELEVTAAAGTGFWIEGPLDRYVNDVQVEPDVDSGHQRLWVHSSRRLNFIYDRPQSSDPRLGG